MSHAALDRVYTTQVTPDWPLIQTLKSYLKFFSQEIILVVCHSWKNNWTYDHTRPIYRGDNLNKKTFINIPCVICSHSPIGHAKNWSEVGVLPIDRLDASVLDKGPYPAMIWYLQHGSKLISVAVHSCGDIPSMELSPEWEKFHHQNIKETQQKKATGSSFARRFRWGEP